MAETMELLRALRKEVALTQAGLAERAGLRRTEIAQLESGILKCRFASTRRKLAKGFGVPFEIFDAYLEEERTLTELLEARGTTEAS